MSAWPIAPLPHTPRKENWIGRFAVNHPLITFFAAVSVVIVTLLYLAVFGFHPPRGW